MKPIKYALIGGGGFVSRRLAVDLYPIGEGVPSRDAQETYRHVVPFLKLDLTKREQPRAIELKPDDIAYNLSARMLSCKRRVFFWSVNHDGVESIFQMKEEKSVRVSPIATLKRSRDTPSQCRNSASVANLVTITAEWVMRPEVRLGNGVLASNDGMQEDNVARRRRFGE